MRNSDGLDGYRADKVTDGLKQAVEFARGDCPHEWRPRSMRVDYVDNTMAHTKECKLCGVRVTNIAPRDPAMLTELR